MKYIFFLLTISVLISGCSVNRAKVDNSLKKYFDAKNVDGCFTMLDNGTGKITVFNMGMDTTRMLPASTFKIVNSLIALQTGVAPDEHLKINWDGVVRSNKAWNKTMDMAEAFKVSSVPYFQEIARRIGHDTMKAWIDSLSYGNMDISGPVDSFWLNNHLKISPDEQLGLVKKLFFDQLPFQKRVQQIVRNMMLQEDNTLYKLSYKTGLGIDEQQNRIGWVVGWIEENNHVYFFVTTLKSSDPNVDMSNSRLDITRDILKQYGFFEGKK
ncbi:MAG: class D beta-lactamase [Chitinophagaceae bacterium]|nr:class D beta-lactamase [Bacteroidota bacterium]MCC6258595.1 class D beta-lactamase [Chitinophagaceae bacterium]MCW5915754.1 class D beta-lactamase [Ferruginibacter sp.]